MGDAGGAERDEALEYHGVLEKGEAHGTALKDVKSLSRHGAGDVGGVPSMRSSGAGVSRTHALREPQRDTGRPPGSRAGSLMGRSGEQAGEQEQGPGWGRPGTLGFQAGE